MKQAEVQRIDDCACALIRQNVPDVMAIYRFGTFGTANQRADSDLDLAFLARRARETIATWDLAQEIAGRVGRDVDLVDLGRASTVMAAQIIAYGKRLACFDDGRCAAFEAYTLADYAHLNEKRRALLDDVAARRRVYG